MGAPIGYTCPAIDEGLEKLKTVEDSLSEAIDLVSDMRHRTGILEELRTSNDTLRRWGEKMEDEKEELQLEVDELHKRVAELEQENEYLETKLRSLEK